MDKSNVEPIGSALQPSVITRELSRLMELLEKEFPDAAGISFEFTGKLWAHVDLRKFEDVAVVETRMRTMGPGLFDEFARGDTPNHPFLHRVSALVRT